MVSFLFTVIMLTVLFGATSGLAFVFRKSALKGREGIMYYVWLAVVILALIPIRIGEPRIILFPQEQTQINNNAAKSNVNGNNTLKLSELLNYNNLMAVLTDNAKEPDANANKEIQVADRAGDTGLKDAKHKNNANILKLIGEYKDILISGLLIIWFAGFIFVTARTIYGYFKMKKLFYKESDICADEKINGIFNECLKTVGLNRRVTLRIMEWDFSSPCVCGLFNPTVFIDGSCVSMNGQKLKYIFIHELYHIKRYDMLYKILSIIVAGVHWFNPLTYKVVRTIGEDCELSVDRQVMNIFGNEQSDCYMNVILDVAEQKCAVKNNRQKINVPSASLFFGEKQNIDFLKRRYANMKNITNKKRLIIALSLILTAIISMNIIIMSSCGIIGTTAAADTGQTNAETIYNFADANVYEAAIRMYFGLLPDEDITQEQLDEITEIQIIRGMTARGAMTANINNISLGNLTPVSFIINGMEFNLVPSIVNKRVYEEYIVQKFTETYAVDESEHSRELDRINAYYTIKDPNDPAMTPEAIEELRLTYPVAFEYPIAVFDPNASTREYMHMLGFYATAGLLDDSFVTNGTIHAGYLSNLPNLKTVTFINLTVENLDLLPETVDVRQENFGYVYVDENSNIIAMWSDGTPAEQPASETSSDQPQGPSGVFEVPNYGINTAEDGTEYLEFKNQSLYAALMEYFGLDRWYGSYITPDMLSQINSIEVKIKPEYNYLYDNKGLREEFNLDCKYIEYTINGKTLDILPEKFIEGGIIEGHMDNASLDINQYFNYEPGYYIADYYKSGYYITKPDLTLEDKLFIYDLLAYGGAVRMPVYRNDDGSYFTDYIYGSWSMYVLGFPARYYDKDEYDATDIAYMPNLKEFNLDGISEKK